MDKQLISKQHYKCANNKLINNTMCRCWLKFNGYFPYYNSKFIYKSYKKKLYCLDCHYIISNGSSVPMEID